MLILEKVQEEDSPTAEGQKDVGRGSAVCPFTHSGYNVGELGTQKYQDQQPTITKLSLGREGKGERLMNTNYI